MSFLEEQIGLIQNAIDKGIISKDSHLISYHKQLIIYMLDNMFKLAGTTVSMSRTVTTQSFSKGKMSPLNIYKGDFALNQ